MSYKGGNDENCVKADIGPTSRPALGAAFPGIHLAYDGIMNVTFACPHCETGVRLEVAETQRSITCPHCRQDLAVPANAFEEGQLTRCLVCPSTDLFVRKDFPQRVGVAIVVVGFVASSIAWGYTLPILTFGILFATAFVDVVLYAFVPEALMCYRCGAQYRMAPGLERHGAFNLETHERYRQQTARLAGKG